VLAVVTSLPNAVSAVFPPPPSPLPVRCSWFGLRRGQQPAPDP
jgi:hypothetical protein